MSKFKYKFEGLLQLREKLEDIKKREYAESLQILELKKEEKRQIAKSLQTNTTMLKKTASGNIDKNKIEMYNQYHSLLKKQDITATGNLKRATKATDDKRNELLYAMKNKKTLSILKDKKYEQFIEDEKKSEQQIIDEIVSFSYSNNID